MAATGKWYGQAGLNQWGTTAANRVDFVTDTIQGTLHTVTYTPNQDTDDFFNDATNELATAGGYTAGGITLTTKTLTYDAASNTVRFKADPLVWAAATFTARYCVLWKNTAGASSTDPLMGYIDFGADQAPAGIEFRVTGDATDGFLRAVVA